MNALYSLMTISAQALLAYVGTGVLEWYGLFGIAIPYLAILIFLGGFTYRVVKWARAPVPFHVPTVTGQQKSLPWIRNSSTESPSSTAGLLGRMAATVASVSISVLRRPHHDLRHHSHRLAHFKSGDATRFDSR